MDDQDFEERCNHRHIDDRDERRFVRTSRSIEERAARLESHGHSHIANEIRRRAGLLPRE